MRKWRRKVLSASIACLMAATAIKSIIEAHRTILKDTNINRKHNFEEYMMLKTRREQARLYNRTSIILEQSSDDDARKSTASRKSKANTASGGPRLRLPNVLLVGAQKGGSTALASWLFEQGVCQPKAFPGEPESRNKEAHFFNKIERYERGPTFYARRFLHCEGKPLVMDATPDYLPFADRVRFTYDEVGGGRVDSLRVMMILREPMARELSLYNHKTNFYWQNSSRMTFWRGVLKKDGKLMSFGQYMNRKALKAIDAVDGSCRRPLRAYWPCFGLYARPLKQWLTLFDPSQVLVLAYDELVKDEEKLKWRVRSFLGLNDSSVEIKEVNTQHSEHKLSLPPCLLQSKLARAFSRGNEELYKLLKKKSVPLMEQRPFPKFVLSNCTTSDGDIKLPIPYKV